MAEPTTRMGMIGAGWPGMTQAAACGEAGGFKIVAVADLIPDRRARFIKDFGATREFVQAGELISDRDIDAVSISLPNHEHLPMALAALKAGKHVLIESPPALNASETKKLAAAATKAGRVLLFALPRRFGGAEQSARQAIEKGYLGEAYHVRTSWMRTRGIPRGTGWYTDRARAGGGAMIDLGTHMLDLGWHLLGGPKLTSVFATTQSRFQSLVPETVKYDVEDSAFAILKFEGGKTIELAVSWALNQPPMQQGTLCRVYGSAGAIEVYTPTGAQLYRSFDEKGQSKATELKQPRVQGYAALMRHFRECITGKATPLIGGEQAVQLMQMIDAVYKSAESGKAVAGS